MQRNPFRYLQPVAPDAFLGRWPLVKRIALDLLLDEGDSHAIIAGRRCGKSSLLNALAHQLRQPSTTDAGDWLALPLALDFKAMTLISVEEFFAQVLAEVRRCVDVATRRRPPDAWPTPVPLAAHWFEQLAESRTLTLRDFTDALGYVLDQLDQPRLPVRLVLLLDEVDETLDQSWTETLFNQLRALIYSSELKERVRLVLTGSRRFLDQVNMRGSPLWNVLKLHYLAVMDETAIGQLCARAAGLPVVAAQAVWQQSGGHPFVAQYLLHHLWEQTTADFTKADPTLLGRLSARFQHEQLFDLEGWAHAIEAAGLRTYALLPAPPDWIEESELVPAIADPTLNLKRGLIALCYHGLAAHDEGWAHYQRTGALFKQWFDDQGLRYLAQISSHEPSSPLPKLRAALASLYPEANSALRIAEDAGLPTKSITFGGNATNLWHNILAEAQKHQDAITRLTELALEDYPNNPLLRAAAQSYFDTQNTGKG